VLLTPPGVNVVQTRTVRSPPATATDALLSLSRLETFSGAPLFPAFVLLTCERHGVRSDYRRGGGAQAVHKHAPGGGWRRRDPSTVGPATAAAPLPGQPRLRAQAAARQACPQLALFQKAAHLSANPRSGGAQTPPPPGPASPPARGPAPGQSRRRQSRPRGRGPGRGWRPRA